MSVLIEVLERRCEMLESERDSLAALVNEQKEQIAGLYADLTGQEHRLGSKIEMLERDLQIEKTANDVTHTMLQVRLALAEKVVEAARLAGCYCDGFHWDDCRVGKALAEYDGARGKE